MKAKKNELITLVSLENELVSIPKKRLQKEFATKQIQERYDKVNVFAMSGILIYPCNSENKSYAHIAWRGSVVDGRKIATIGFYDIITGTFVDVPSTFSFIPFSGFSSIVGKFKYSCTDEGIDVVDGRND